MKLALGGLWLLLAALSVAAPGRALGQSGVTGWGFRAFDSRHAEGTYVEVAAGTRHTVARRRDGTVTFIPRAASAPTICRPTKPLPPSTRTSRIMAVLR